MRIGIVTTWFERGAGYVSKQFKQVLESLGHQVQVYARGGERFAKGDPAWDTEQVTWNKFLFSPVSTDIDKVQYLQWLKNNQIEAVIFNEQQYWQPVLWTKDLGIKTIAYIDFYTHETVSFFTIYDQLWCNTKRHASVFDWHEGMKYLPWGTNINIFQPQDNLANRQQPETTSFFHSCGMSPQRKGTDLVLQAADQLRRKAAPGKFKLVIHTQTDLTLAFPSLKSLIDDLVAEGLLDLHERTTTAPGLYHLGHVYVYPSRLEGIGLTVAEALAVGLPVIVTDEGPMNEFVEPVYGRLIKVERHEKRADGYYWPMAHADIVSLVENMEWFIMHSQQLPQAQQTARQYAVQNLDFSVNSHSIADALNDIRYIPLSQESVQTVSQYDRTKSMFYKNVPDIYRLLFGMGKRAKACIYRYRYF